MTVSNRSDEGSGLTQRGPLRILFVTQNVPFPVRGGSTQRTHLLVKSLRRLGQVDFVILGSPQMRAMLEQNGYPVKEVLNSDDGVLGRFASRVSPRISGKMTLLLNILFPGKIRYRANRNHLEVLTSLFSAGRYDVVIGRYFGPSVRAGVHHLPRAIIDIDDLESQKFASWLHASRFPRLGMFVFSGLIARMRQLEMDLSQSLSRVWVTAHEDAASLHNPRTDVIPNVPFIENVVLPRSPDSNTVLFVGSFDYRINLNAIFNFVEEIWPLVRSRSANLKLRIVGGGLGGDAKRKLESVPGVVVVGFVSDLADEYRSSCFAIVPIWEGGGTKIKVVESLAFGRTCVVAEPSMRGYLGIMQHGKSVLVANTAAEFANCVLSLATSRELRHQLEEEGLRVVRGSYSHKALAEKIQASVLLAIAAETTPKTAVKP